ncbi:MAG: EamA family transporter [Candidatus Eisenbacteria bacterium]|nr:EamA family transporter [Candidatus Latescibacterota bacterium]MBD3300905.1 EamA family transporter [Candidatus Eisenbacteria bacterium]
MIWSNSFHSIAWMRDQVGAWDLVLLRFFPVALVCLVWFFASGPRSNLRLLSRSPIRIGVIGSMIVLSYNLLLNWGQGRVPAGTASLLISTNPFLTYLLALAVGQEGFRKRKVAGLVISFAAVYLLLADQGRRFGPGYGLSALSVLGAPLSWAIATIVGKPLVGREPPLRVIFLSLTVGSLPALALAPLDPTVRAAVPTFGPVEWFAVLHLSILCTLLGFAIWYAALRRLPASSVAAFVLLNPPLTILFGPLWGAGAPSASVLGYGAWILAGILLSTWRVPDRR